MALQPFQRVYNIPDFGITANKTITTGQWNKIGSVTVPAQQMVTWGSGTTVGGVDTRGQAYIKLSDGTATGYLTGKWRLALSNANETNIIVVAEQRTEMLVASQTSRTSCVLMGEYPVKAKQDSKLIIYYYPDSASNETMYYAGTSSAITLPVTVYQ